MNTPPELPRSTPPPIPSADRASSPKRAFRLVFWIVGGTLLLGVFVVCFGVYRVNKFRSWKQAQDSLPKRSHTVEAPPYEILLGQDLSGSGFHFKTGEAKYIACSLHQFDGKMPGVMGSIDFEEVIKIVKAVHQDGDVQILAYESESLNKIPELSHDPATKIDTGLPVYVYSDLDVLKGHVTSVDQRNGTIEVRMAEGFEAQGCSGAPIVSGESGTVIGVLLSANSPTNATRITAQILKLPQSSSGQ